MPIKRRIDTSKLRRPLKRSKITESVYGSFFIYIKFFLVWLLVLAADFLLEFRFEYLWPFWLLMRSAYDSFKYQGLVFSLFFLALALFSDVICLMVLPVHWLFFAASTYVWVQFVWHTDRGLGLPTISMWLLFIYVEASVRLKELKNLPFHLDLCRPFAAHCIGYPVVTLGYGVKSYVGYKIRQRKIFQVSKENDFYIELINQSLPPEQLDNANGSIGNQFPIEASEQAIQNGGINKPNIELLLPEKPKPSEVSPKKHSEDHNLNELENRLIDEHDRKLPNGHTVCPIALNGGKRTSPLRNNDHCEENEDSDSEDSSNASTSSCSPVHKKEGRSKSTPEPRTRRHVLSDENPVLIQLKEEKRRMETTLNQKENELKQLRQDVHSSRSQLHTVANNEKSLKSDLHQLKNDNEIYQQKIQNMSATRQQDRSSIATLERKLKSERDARQLAENQLREERKKAKADESTYRQQRDNSAVHESCTTRRLELEEEMKQLREKVNEKEDKMKQLEEEVEELCMKRKEHDSNQLKKETEDLVLALTAIQGKNTHLENSLSSETRLKLDLFSALGETRRRLELSQGQLLSKDQEIVSLKAKIAEVLAVMPLSSNGDSSPVYGNHPITTPPLGERENVPNGSVFIPKGKNGLL